MFLAIICVILAFLYYIWPLNYESQLKKLGISESTQLVAIFHPFCDSGGGGERVLWMGVQALQQKFPNMVIAIYTWAGADFKGIPSKVKSQFGVELNNSMIIFLPLKTWRFLEADRYPRLTLIMSSLGSLIPGWEALCLLRPKILMETVGFSFLYPLFKLFRAKIIVYVHYPTISSDMLIAVQSRAAAFNNHSIVANSRILSFLKLQYYLLFSVFYRFAGSFSDIVLANSSWTAKHITEIWRMNSKTKILFPPCDVSKLTRFDLENRERRILSVAQFRPEKNHRLQIDILGSLLSKYPEYKVGPQSVKLVLLGGVRNNHDEKIVADIQNQINMLGLQESVEIVRNAPFSTLLEYLKTSMIGIHTMKNEHFGISIIEYMASGLIALAHESGGPKMDILTKPGYTGFLASDINSYTEKLREILLLSEKDALLIKMNGREFVKSTFSEQTFAAEFVKSFEQILHV